MNDYTPTNFVDNQTVITAAFLNALQTYIAELKTYVDTLATRSVPQLFVFDEQEAHIDLPTSIRDEATVSAGSAMPTTDCIVGDVLIGTETGYLAVVTAVAGQILTVEGTGIKLNY